MATIINGKEVSAKILAQVQEEAKELNKQYNIIPGLAVVVVGDDPASHIYVASKEKKAQELGFYSKKIVLPKETSQQELLAIIAQLNGDDKIHGILVQSPPPKHIDEEAVILAICPEKDVDGFHPFNVGKMLIGSEGGFLPCTPNGCMQLLKHYHIDPTGKQAVVLGRSNIVGKPMASLLIQKSDGANATVTIAHSQTKNLTKITREADIIVVALGKAQFLTSDMVKEGVVVIDVGINRIEDKSKMSGFRLVGDVDFESVQDKCSFITPVPGGVGPMTIAMLMKNTLLACKKSFND